MNNVPENMRGQPQNRVDERPGAICASPYSLPNGNRIGYQHGAVGDGSPCFSVVQLWDKGGASDPPDGAEWCYTIQAVRDWIEHKYKPARPKLMFMGAEEYRGPNPIIIQ